MDAIRETLQEDAACGFETLQVSEQLSGLARYSDKSTIGNCFQQIKPFLWMGGKLGQIEARNVTIIMFKSCLFLGKQPTADNMKSCCKILKDSNNSGDVNNFSF